MSVFTLNSTHANIPMGASRNIGIDHHWVLSVYEFEADGGYELHVAFVGEARGIRTGYWCNLTPDQCERIVGLVKSYKSDDLTCADCASEIVEVLKEEPDIDFAGPLGESL
jgi:hypothetical protein